MGFHSYSTHKKSIKGYYSFSSAKKESKNLVAVVHLPTKYSRSLIIFDDWSFTLNIVLAAFTNATFAQNNFYGNSSERASLKN